MAHRKLHHRRLLHLLIAGDLVANESSLSVPANISRVWW